MVEIKEITQKSIWEKFLLSIKDEYPFFQSFVWGEIQKGLGSDVLRLGLYDEKKLVGLLQIVDVVAKRGHYLYLRQGPVLQTYSAAYLDAYIGFAKKQAKKRNASFIRISRFPQNEEYQKYFASQKFISSAIQTIDAQVCWVLDITKSEEELLKNMRKSHRYLIKKAPTMSLKIIQTKDAKKLKEFLPLYQQLSVRKHFVPHKGVIEEFEQFSKNDEEVLFLAEYEGKIISGAIIAFVGNTAIYRHSASDDNFRHIPSSYLIQWEAIKEAKKRKKTLYNFWGIAPIGSKNHSWSGLTLFKTGFGGEYKHFLPTLDLPLSFGYWKNYLIDWIGTKRKK